MDPASLLISVTCLAFSAPLAWMTIRAYRQFGGLRFVACPETAQPAVVQIQVARALASKVAGRGDLRLRSCSRWPEKGGCNQACLSQIKGSPIGCRSRACSLPTTPARKSPPPGRPSKRFVGTTNAWLD